MHNKTLFSAAATVFKYSPNLRQQDGLKKGSTKLYFQFDIYSQTSLKSWFLNVKTVALLHSF